MGQRASLRRKGHRQDSTWYVWFRHPVLNRAVERSLKTPDEKLASKLAEILNLILADEQWHRRVRPGTPPVIVEAFYEPIKHCLEGIRYYGPEIEYIRPDGPVDILLPVPAPSPLRQAAADQLTVDHSFDVLFWKRRYDRAKKILQGRTRLTRTLERKIGELERRLSGAGTPPVQEAFTLFKKAQEGRISPRTMRSRIGRVKKFVDAVGGETPVGSLKPTQIDEFVFGVLKNDKESVSPVTQSNYRVEIGTFLNWCARKWDYVSPMMNTERIRRTGERRSISFLTPDEVRTVLNSCVDVYWRTVLATFIYSGLRAAELRWLQVEDVDLERQVIHVKTVSTPFETKAPKTGERAVHYHDALQPYLTEYITAGFKGQRFFFPKHGRDRVRSRVAGDPEVWRETSLSHSLARALKIPSKIVAKHIDALTLRHTFGSLMIRNGFNYIEVSTILGNSPEICRRHYARLSPEEVRAEWTVSVGAPPAGPDSLPGPHGDPVPGSAGQ